MFMLSANNIVMTRGDTGVINLNLTDSSGSPYVFNEGDILSLSVKKALKDDDYILHKESTRPRIFLSHEETNDLAPGNYFYDLELKTALGQVQTFGPYKFTVKYDVTR